MRALGFFLLPFLVACGGEAAPEPSAAFEQVPRRAQEEGLARCGEVLERIEGPDTAPSFARLIRECSGMWARRRCREALAADEFSRDGIQAACRDDYCGDLRPLPSFCTVELPTDREFLTQFAPFARRALRRDLRRIMDADGAAEIAGLYADLVQTQAER